MKIQLFFLMIAAALTATLCSLERDLKSEKDVPTKNIMSNVLDKWLRGLLNKTNYEIPLIPLGVGNGVLENVRIDLNNPAHSPVLGEGALSIKNMTVTFERIIISGVYNRIWVISGVQFNQTGNFSADLEEVRLSTGVTIRLNGSDILITDFPHFDFSLQNSKIFFEPLLACGPIGNALNDILSYGLSPFIKATNGEFINEYGDDIASFLNPIINCLTHNTTHPTDCLRPGKIMETGFFFF